MSTSEVFVKSALYKF